MQIEDQNIELFDLLESPIKQVKHPQSSTSHVSQGTLEQESSSKLHQSLELSSTVKKTNWVEFADSSMGGDDERAGKPGILVNEM